MVSSSSRVFALVCVLIWLALLGCVGAATNVTVDDQFGDEVTGALPAYSPTSSWKLGTTCSDCLASPDSSQAYGGTWHESTRKLGNTSFTIEISFTGTAVYAYFILPNYTQGASVKTEMSFMLDWSTLGAFNYDSGTSPNFVYNALGYSATNLANTAHTLVISSVVDGPEGSTVLFDRLVYTTEDGSASSSNGGLTRGSIISSTEFSQGASSSGTGLPTLSAPQSTNTSTSTSSYSSPAPTMTGSDKLPQTAIIGGSVAGVVAIILVAVIAWCIRRRRRHAATVHSLQYIPSSKAKTSEPTDQGSIGEQGVISIRHSVSNFFTGKRRTDSLSVVPSSSVVHRPNEEDARPEDLPQLEKDPFQRDIFDEKQERLAARSRSSPSDRAASSPFTSSPRTGRSTRTERMLLDYIASLQAEVDRLQDRQDTADMPPPPSYGDAGGRLV